jgi:hypothetical protein
MAFEHSIATTYEPRTNWVAKPLNKTGDLEGWLSKMNRACPNPVLGEIVWLKSSYGNTSYKAMKFRTNGDVIWQRGEVIREIKEVVNH